MLEYYKVNASQAPSLGESFASIVPKKLTKLHLISNDLGDPELKNLLIGLSETQGLHTLFYQQNGFGPQSVFMLKEMIDKDCFIKTKKLIFKETTYTSSIPVN